MAVLVTAIHAFLRDKKDVDGLMPSGSAWRRGFALIGAVVGEYIGGDAGVGEYAA